VKSGLARMRLHGLPGLPKPKEGNWLVDALGRDASRIGEMLVSGIMAPGNALAGNYDQVEVGPNGSVTPMDPRLVQDAGNLASFAGVGSMPMARPMNSLGMFGGRMAATADHAALAKAEKMATAGASKEDIWNATGWFKGADDKWRFEIPDNGATYRDYKVPSRDPFAKGQAVYDFLTQRGYDLPRNSVTGGVVARDVGRIKPEDYSAAWAHAHSTADAPPTVPLSNVFEHDKLFNAYPGLKGVEVTNDVPHGYAGMSWGEKVAVGNGPGIDGRSTMLHELQHEIQNVEGFAKGSNKTSAEDVLNEASQAVAVLAFRKELEANARLHPEMSTAEREAAVLKDYEQLGLKPPGSRVRRMARETDFHPTSELESAASVVSGGAYDPIKSPGLWSETAIGAAYRNHAGEVEARNVQTRRNMSPADRAATPPWITQDVPNPKQIVQFKKYGILGGVPNAAKDEAVSQILARLET
jgi:hypothetical protein